MSESFTPRSLLARAIQELRRKTVTDIEIAEALEYLRRVDVELERAEKEGSHHEAPKALRAEVDALRKSIDRAWNEGFDFAMKSCGWQEDEEPATEGLYVVRDSKGNVEVGMWYAKTVTQPAKWTREFRDVDRDDIVAWMAIPDWITARNAYKLAALAKEKKS